MLTIDAMEQALVAPAMESVIAVTERYQYLEEHRDARVFTAYRALDHTLCIGFARNLNLQQRQSLDDRGFVVFGEREGTQREHRLLLMTLEEIGFRSSYGPDYFLASQQLVSQLRNLGWPLGQLSQVIQCSRGAQDGKSRSY
ncbi:MAG: hypothetical protein ACON4T_09500 [Synechococcus sp.]